MMTIKIISLIFQMNYVTLCETCVEAKNLYSVLRVDRATYPAEVW